MFDIGWGELVVIGVVALIAIGPKELPGALRTLGHWMGKVRRMAAEFQNQFNEAMREAEMADLKQQVDTLTSSFDPIGTARREIEGAVADKPAAPAASTTEPSAEGGPPAPAAEGASGPSAAPAEGATEPTVAPAEVAAPPPAPPEVATDGALAGEEPHGAKPGDRPA